MTVAGASPFAFVEAAPATLDEGARAAARRLMQCRQPLFAGLATDVAGARAAIALAERVGGVVDHTHSAALLADLDLSREGGAFVVAPAEAAARADFLLIVGDDPSTHWPDFAARFVAAPARPHGETVARRIVWLAPQAGARLAGDAGAVETIVVGTDEKRPAALAALRARAGRRLKAPLADPALERLAGELGAAKFGVAVWAAGAVDPLALAMLGGLVADLNATTRFSSLPLAPPGDAAGVTTVAGWMTGFPPRLGFGRGWPEHDPWRFDAARLIASGETDCVVFVDAFGGAPPPLPQDLPLIALVASGAALARAPQVRFAVGRPGVDHDAVLHTQAWGTLAAAPGRAPSATPSVAAVLARIAAQLDDGSASAC